MLRGRTISVFSILEKMLLGQAGQAALKGANVTLVRWPGQSRQFVSLAQCLKCSPLHGPELVTCSSPQQNKHRRGGIFISAASVGRAHSILAGWVWQRLHSGGRARGGDCSHPGRAGSIEQEKNPTDCNLLWSGRVCLLRFLEVPK